MKQPPIADYALIGDTRTAALVSSHGSIDWLCLPRFDSEPVVGRLLDTDLGGCFAITPRDIGETQRRYRGDSPVLETTWRTPGGLVRLTDAFISDLTPGLLPQALLVRHVECVEGEASLDIEVDVRTGFAGESPRWERRGDTPVATWGPMALAFSGFDGIEFTPRAPMRLEVHSGQDRTLVMAMAEGEPLVIVSHERCRELLDATESWWTAWSQDIRYDGPYRDSVVRSLVTLRLLTYSPSGAPVAAPTTSLPERIGGDRNWDYRFSWPRDAAMGMMAFQSAGKLEEGAAFLRWLLHAGRLTRPKLNVLYDVFGRPQAKEKELSDISGYRDSRPVRSGNLAGDQHQLDVYGWVLAAACRFAEGGGELNGETRRMLAGLADFASEHWSKPDAGVWESRAKPRHHVHSKMMAWLGLRRALALSNARGKDGPQEKRWLEALNAIADGIRRQGWSPETNSYTRSYGSPELDAAVLVPLIDFEEPGSERARNTIAAICRELGAGGPLLYRYGGGEEDARDKEGAFLVCSTWLIEALAATGDLDRAHSLMAQVCALANDVGLLAEQVDPASGEMLGNFPQALSHSGLVLAAYALEGANP